MKIPKKWGIKYGAIKDIPGSKDIVISGAWTFFAVIIPFLSSGIEFKSSIIITSLYVFILMGCHSGFFAIEDMQGDQIVGRETVPVILGRKLTLRILYSSLIFLSALIFFSTLAGLLPYYSYLLVLPVIYTMAYLMFKIIIHFL